jgi:hypothetical protein
MISARREFLQFSLGVATLGLIPQRVLSSSPPMLSGAKIKGDIEILRQAYTQMHPGLYRYATPAQVAARFDALERDWSRDQSLPSAYLSLSRFLGSIKCGHTYANFYNQSEAVKKALFAEIPRLPFMFRWIDGQMIITHNQSGNAILSPGTAITRVNGAPVAEILKRLTPLARADGSNDVKRHALLELRGEDEWETFDIFYNLLYPGAKSYALDITTVGGRTGRVNAPSITLEQRRSLKRNVPAARADGSVWDIVYRGNGIAILSMPNWGLYDSKWNWEAYLDTCFTELATRNVRALIVDIRGNEGGLDCGNAIIARMTDKPLMIDATERRVRYRRVSETLKPYLDTWDPSFATLGENASDVGNGFFKLDADAARSIAPKGPRFNGKLIVLTDAQNSSATFQFADIVQSSKLGRVIGNPTGGNKRGINADLFYFLRLPNSGLEADLPLVGTFPKSPQPDTGVNPDINIPISARDIADSRDPVMKRAIIEAQQV